MTANALKFWSSMDWISENFSGNHGTETPNIGVSCRCCTNSFLGKSPAVIDHDALGTHARWKREKGQWPFQDPKLEVPTIYKAYVREYPHKIWPYMVQYLHFRILKSPLKRSHQISATQGIVRIQIPMPWRFCLQSSDLRLHFQWSWAARYIPVRFGLLQLLYVYVYIYMCVYRCKYVFEILNIYIYISYVISNMNKYIYILLY